jgi:iron complex outermembrane receptor protein
MIPTDIIGNLKISTGTNSVLYGANVLGGAINITTSERESEGLGGNVSLQIGEAGRKYSAVKIEGKDGKFNYLGNISFMTRDGLKAPKDNSLNLRTGEGENLIPNSQNERITAYGRGEYSFSETDKLGVSFNHVNGNKGVIPVNNPEGVNTRFWKYPEWMRSIVTVNGSSQISESISFRGAIWGDQFNQTIEDYQSIAFEEINEIQYDDDNTFGTRMNLKADISDNDILNFTINGFTSSHTEEIEDADGNSVTKDYGQTTSSFGAEYKRLQGDWVFTIGSSYDRFDISDAGDFTEANGSSYDDIAAVFGVNYNISSSINLFGNVGKKSRFPTMRESFSAALNRFVVNPNLKPETGILSEIGIDYSAGDLETTLSLFANSFSDLITQAAVEGDTLNRRQRINLDEATILGAEFRAKYYVTNDIDISGHFTYMNSKGTVDGVEQDLEAKPEIIAFLQADWRVGGGFDLMAELDFMGRQYGISDITDVLEEIDQSALVNLRMSYLTTYNENLYTFFIRANNIFDQSRLTRIGISAPGRMVYGGVSVAF